MIQEYKNRVSRGENAEKIISDIMYDAQRRMQKVEPEDSSCAIDAIQVLMNIRKDCFVFTSQVDAIMFEHAFKEYRDTLKVYSQQIDQQEALLCQHSNSNIRSLSIQIVELRKQLLPVTNENIGQHTEIYHKNKSVYQQIEQLHKERVSYC